MKRILLAIVLLSIAITPSFADEWEKIPLFFQLGDNTVIAASATQTGIYRMPQAARIDTIYFTSASAVASDASNYMTLTFYRNNSAYGTITTNGAAAAGVTLVATTPAALTPTARFLSAGDIVQFKLTKGGSGVAMTDMGVTMTVTNTTDQH